MSFSERSVSHGFVWMLVNVPSRTENEEGRNQTACAKKMLFLLGILVPESRSGLSLGRPGCPCRERPAEATRAFCALAPCKLPFFLRPAGAEAGTTTTAVSSTAHRNRELRRHSRALVLCPAFLPRGQSLFALSAVPPLATTRMVFATHKIVPKGTVPLVFGVLGLVLVLFPHRVPEWLLRLVGMCLLVVGAAWAWVETDMGAVVHPLASPVVSGTELPAPSDTMAMTDSGTEVSAVSKPLVPSIVEPAHSDNGAVQEAPEPADSGLAAAASPVRQTARQSISEARETVERLRAARKQREMSRLAIPDPSVPVYAAVSFHSPACSEDVVRSPAAESSSSLLGELRSRTAELRKNRSRLISELASE